MSRHRLHSWIVAALVAGLAPATHPPPSPGTADIEAGEDVVILEEVQEIDILSVRSARVRYRRVAKVLTPRGAESERFASVYFNPSMVVRELKGAVTPPQGKRIETKKQQIEEGAAFASFELYADTRHRTIRFPGLVPGATVEHSFEVEIRNLFYLRFYDELAFQELVPARLKRLVARAPVTMPLRTSVRGNVQHRVEEKDGMVTHVWEARDVPALKKERDMPPPRDIYPRVRIYPRQIYWENTPIDATNWTGIAKWYWDLSRERMIPSSEVAAKARELTAGVTDPMEATRRLFEYAQKKINYVAIGLGIGGYQPHHNSEVYRYSYGDCKDKTTLFIAMLRAIGLKGFPVLILTRDDGVTESDFPSTTFNHVIAAVPTPEGYLYLDPTDTRTQFGDLPWVDQGANALVVKDDGEGELVATPVASPDRNRRHRLVVAQVGPSGDLTGTYVIDMWGQRRALYLDFLDSKPSEQEDDLADLMAWLCPGAVMLGHEVAPPKGPEDPVRITIRFQVPRFVTRAGASEVVAPHLVRFPGLTGIAAYPGRRLPVFFDYLFAESAEIRLALPPGRTLRRMPSDRQVQGPGLTASTRHELVDEGNRRVLVIRREVAVERREIPVSDYQALRDFLSGVAQEEARAVTLDAA
jgi:hypothetical protein